VATEAAKTNSLREADFFTTYLSGSVLDIGAGADPVAPHAQIFDQPQGDANKILDYLDAEQFDCVHSSHCLEHMFNPLQALDDWWQLVKPGGYMITIVPQEDLYEQFNWPSIFNEDHKSTYRLGGDSSWSPVSIDILAASKALKGAVVIKSKLWDNNYNYDLMFPKDVTPKDRRAFWNRQVSSIARRIKDPARRAKMLKGQLLRGYPIDQTSKSNALAQIEIIIQKRKK